MSIRSLISELGRILLAISRESGSFLGYASEENLLESLIPDIEDDLKWLGEAFFVARAVLNIPHAIKEGVPALVGPLSLTLKFQNVLASSASKFLPQNSLA